jgi:hypothetical protein
VTLNDDEAAAEAADALQAAYFRRSLCDERALLLAEISKRRYEITKRTDRGQHARDSSARITCAECGGSGAVFRPTHRRARSSLRQSNRRVRLAAELRQLLAGTTQNKQRHEVAQRSSIKPGMVVVNHRSDRIRRHTRVALLKPIHHLLNSRPFA